MLFNIVAIILALYAITAPYWLFKAVKFGIKCAEKPEEVAEEPVFELPKKHNTEMSDEMKAALNVLYNIDAYDGTSNGQREVN